MEKILPEVLRSTREQCSDYKIYPKLNVWNNPMPSGCVVYDNGEKDVDEADVDIIIYDVQSRKILNSYNISASGCPHTVNGIPIGTYTPEGQFKQARGEWFKTQNNEDTAAD